MKAFVRHILSRFGLGGGLIVMLAVSTGFALTFETDHYFKITRSIETFGNIYKEIAQNYVDEVDPEKFMRAGIDGMLETLDPYTVYLDEDEREQMDLITTGKYAGIGVSIGVRDGNIVVIGLMDGYSAQRQGVKEGDRFLRIDTVKVTGMKLDSVRALVRGEAGTEIHITIEREGEKTPLEFVLVREEIQLKNVTYFGMPQPGIGYLRLERFTRTAGEEMRQAITALQSSGNLKGIILDLRDNPGGLLDMAVDVVEKFVPKGSLIVSTRGRLPDSEHKYVATEDPMTTLPLIVLVNGRSASASEIVAGAIQDLDRGLIVGTRSFGKGLVQTVIPVSTEGAELKLTTARYYTPSGRSIQEIDYQHRRDGVTSTVPDSLRKEYQTIHHRRVLDAGGIQPDSTVQTDTTSRYIAALYRTAKFFSFANSYTARHKEKGNTFSFDSTIVDEFRDYLTDQKFDYDEECGVKLKELRELATREHYAKDFVTRLDALTQGIEFEKSTAFEKNKRMITAALKVELMGRYRGEHGRIEASFPDDRVLMIAAEMLKNPNLYAKKLGIR
jgi:carboxyl-terminal processing protease